MHLIRSLAAGLRAACVVVLFAACITPASAQQRFAIGLATAGAPVEAFEVTARRGNSPLVVLIGGLGGDDDTSAAVRAAVNRYAASRDRPVRLLAVPLANPERQPLQFPPSGAAYREHSESHVLWRWLGAQAPDLVLIAGDQDAGLAAALGATAVADMGRIPARRWRDGDSLQQLGSITRSEARSELERRRARAPDQVARLLTQHYGREFDQPWYIGALPLMARIRLGEVDAVRQLAEPWVDGTRDSLARPNALVMAGHLLFTDLARATRDPRYTALVRKVADLGFDQAGKPLEAMPYHDRYSDSVFMGTTILAQAGALTGERRYFEMADRHLRFMQQLDLRPDGLYRHRAEADVAWGRGNGFAAIGLALTLSEMPPDAPGRAHALASYRQLMQALLPWQNRDGLWRNVVDHAAAYPEFSGTAMIGFALRRGLDRGWIRGRAYRESVAKAWAAVNSRISATGGFIDVCESTANLTTLEQYLRRTALMGNDPRGGAMALLFATELMADDR